MMKNVLAIAGSLAIAAGAQAGIVGAELTIADFSGGYVNADGSVVPIADGEVAGVTVYRLWATVENVTDTDENVEFGNTILSGSIFNDPGFGTDIDGPNQSFFPVPGFGGAAYDSFLTIGHDGSANTTGGTASQDDGWLAQWAATGSFSSFNGGIFDTSPSAGEDVVSGGSTGFRVLLAQFTVTDGTLFEGSARLGGGGSVADVTWTNVPAPGALALLGVAGLVRSRRRG